MSKITKPTFSLLIALLIIGIATPAYSDKTAYLGNWVDDDCDDDHHMNCATIKGDNWELDIHW